MQPVKSTPVAMSALAPIEVLWAPGVAQSGEWP